MPWGAHRPVWISVMHRLAGGAVLMKKMAGLWKEVDLFFR
jgi:hypothetical protein